MPKHKKGFSKRFSVVDSEDFEIQKLVESTIDTLEGVNIEKSPQQIYREGIRSRCQELIDQANKLSTEQSAA